MTIQRKPRLTHAKVHRLKRLLNMNYKVTEIAEELDIATSTIYDTYIPAGMPCIQDEKKHYWVNGQDFCEWAQQFVTTRQRKPKSMMASNQAFCTRCKTVIVVSSSRVSQANYNGIVRLSGRCSICNSKVSRFVKAKEYENDRAK
jgi:hypothetical protein